MTLLLSASELHARRAVAVGALAPLGDSLAADFEPLIADHPSVPVEKARLTRAGGRCPRDGTALDFDPRSPRAHRCPRCGETFDGDAHYRYWLMWYQLWLAERAVHGAVLAAMRNDARCAATARRILADFERRYLQYPNRDNVLGPSRIFFSTYLESIWLLQICIAVDLLESSGQDGGIGAAVRDRVVAPASALIASYGEGTSNRQVWNAAALLAASSLLGDRAATERAAAGAGGVAWLLEHALLGDGSWYEGENYHVFAHRGLWYGMTMAHRAGIGIPPALVDRFDRGFAIPFLTALPDMTMLARRDSQHAVSLRQWRFAELCELGLARCDDPALRGALGRLYAADIARRDTGRARSSAEAERHAPASALDRADLGWRSLLFARPEPPPLEDSRIGSVLLERQGLGVLRRDGGRTMIALDYGESGGGHGHPDRLNVVLCAGDARWLDDPGTGSYVDPTLHWYRSTLAHSAPLFGRASQHRVDGSLIAWDERGGAGWIAARASGLAPGATAERRIVAMPDYVVDEVTCAGGTQRPALPLHLDGEIEGVSWHAASLIGAGGLEDGFDFVRDAQCATPASWPVRVRAVSGNAIVDVWLLAPAGTVLWRATAPGAPGAGPKRFLLLECDRARGVFTTILSWRAAVRGVEARDGGVVVQLADGSVHEHAGRADGWHVDLRIAGARSSIDLGGIAERDWPADPAGVPSGGGAPLPSSREAEWLAPLLRLERGRSSGEQLTIEIGAPHYRRSEESWEEAGRPSAVVRLGASPGALAIDVESRTGAPVILPDDAVNEMDNEAADVNASGVQIHLLARGTLLGWLVRPGPDARARARALTPASPAIAASWRCIGGGYAIACSIPLSALGDAPPYSLGIAILVNETISGRERRRGQLALGRPNGEWVYLRGDRCDPSSLIPLLID